jgi:type I restriction enzyme M protein
MTKFQENETIELKKSISGLAFLISGANKEFDLEKNWWSKRKATENAWKVSVKDIADRNYNLDSKNPHEVEVNHRYPDELMQEYFEITQQLEAAQSALKHELMQALGGRA